MRLYIEGHNHRLGYAISREWTTEECRAAVARSFFSTVNPVRYRSNIHHARKLVDRYNRRFGDRPADIAYFQAVGETRFRNYFAS